jgi:hypothetical protein
VLTRCPVASACTRAVSRNSFRATFFAFRPAMDFGSPRPRCLQGQTGVGKGRPSSCSDLYRLILHRCHISESAQVSPRSHLFARVAGVAVSGESVRVGYLCKFCPRAARATRAAGSTARAVGASSGPFLPRVVVPGTASTGCARLKSLNA